MGIIFSSRLASSSVSNTRMRISARVIASLAQEIAADQTIFRELFRDVSAWKGFIMNIRFSKMISRTVFGSSELYVRAFGRFVLTGVNMKIFSGLIGEDSLWSWGIKVAEWLLSAKFREWFFAAVMIARAIFALMMFQPVIFVQSGIRFRKIFVTGMQTLTETRVSGINDPGERLLHSSYCW
jgi:hypothetical protein